MNNSDLPTILLFQLINRKSNQGLRNVLSPSFAYNKIRILSLLDSINTLNCVDAINLIKEFDSTLTIIAKSYADIQQATIELAKQHINYAKASHYLEYTTRHQGVPLKVNLSQGNLDITLPEPDIFWGYIWDVRIDENRRKALLHWYLQGKASFSNLAGGKSNGY
jgi:hypothetical protein